VKFSFANLKEFEQFDDDAAAAAKWQRRMLAERSGIATCYYEGIQWIARGIWGPTGYDTVTRLYTNYNPESSKLRVTINRTTRFITKAAAATYPSEFDVEANPPTASMSADDLVRAGSIETATNAAIDASGMLEAARAANLQRCVVGCWGLGLSLSYLEDGHDCVTRAFSFDPSRLILDPSNPSQDLRDHEYVGYEDVWTVGKIRRAFPGLQIDESRLQTIGMLVPHMIEMSRMSDGRLYRQYRAHSKTPGAFVRFMHIRASDGTFPYMFVRVRMNDQNQNQTTMNFDNPVSPFGGDGLPYVMLTGHRRHAPWAIGDAAMVKDDQDRLNLLGSMVYRQVQLVGAPKLVVDVNSLPGSVLERGELESRITNEVGGLLKVDLGRKGDMRHAPQWLVPPQPPPIALDMMSMGEASMRENVFRSEGMMGVTKTHVPDASFQTALEQADQVLGIRVKEDVTQYNKLIRVLAGTVVRNVHEEKPSTVAMLNRSGFDEQDFFALLNTDPAYLGCDLGLRSSSVRFRSHDSRRRDLDSALQMQAVTPVQWRAALAGDLDSPVTDEDRRMQRAARKAAAQVVAGRRWTPLPLGADGTEIYVRAFRAALTDPRVQLDAEAMIRLSEAIEGQEATVMMQQAAGGGAAGMPVQDQGPRTIADLIGVQ